MDKPVGYSGQIVRIPSTFLDCSATALQPAAEFDPLQAATPQPQEFKLKKMNKTARQRWNKLLRQDLEFIQNPPQASPSSARRKMHRMPTDAEMAKLIFTNETVANHGSPLHHLEEKSAAVFSRSTGLNTLAHAGSISCTTGLLHILALQCRQSMGLELGNHSDRDLFVHTYASALARKLIDCLALEGAHSQDATTHAAEIECAHLVATHYVGCSMGLEPVEKAKIRLDTCDAYADIPALHLEAFGMGLGILTRMADSISKDDCASEKWPYLSVVSRFADMVLHIESYLQAHNYPEIDHGELPAEGRKYALFSDLLISVTDEGQDQWNEDAAEKLATWMAEKCGPTDIPSDSSAKRHQKMLCLTALAHFRAVVLDTQSGQYADPPPDSQSHSSQAHKRARTDAGPASPDPQPVSAVVPADPVKWGDLPGPPRSYLNVKVRRRWNDQIFEFAKKLHDTTPSAENVQQKYHLDRQPTAQDMHSGLARYLLGPDATEEKQGFQLLDQSCEAALAKIQVPASSNLEGQYVTSTTEVLDLMAPGCRQSIGKDLDRSDFGGLFMHVYASALACRLTDLLKLDPSCAAHSQQIRSVQLAALHYVGHSLDEVPYQIKFLGLSFTGDYGRAPSMYLDRFGAQLGLIPQMLANLIGASAEQKTSTRRNNLNIVTAFTDMVSDIELYLQASPGHSLSHAGHGAPKGQELALFMQVVAPGGKFDSAQARQYAQWMSERPGKDGAVVEDKARAYRVYIQAINQFEKLLPDSASSGGGEASSV
jgi:hypothetical protein